jgi:hypothetical protein
MHILNLPLFLHVRFSYFVHGYLRAYVISDVIIKSTKLPPSQAPVALSLGTFRHLCYVA